MSWGADSAYSTQASVAVGALSTAKTTIGGRNSINSVQGFLDAERRTRRTSGARAVVAGNTGPTHLAAAVGTPVVCLFAPVVPAVRWRPYGVRHVLLGRQDAPCADSRARVCPVPGHPCLDSVTSERICEAVDTLLAFSESRRRRIRLGTARQTETITTPEAIL